MKGGFNMFSGYINVDEENGRNIFYWFMEAQEKPEDAPVVRHNATVVALYSTSSSSSSRGDGSAGGFEKSCFGEGWGWASVATMRTGCES